MLVGWFWWEGRHWEDTDDAEIDGHIYPISARVAGQVIKVNFDDGQFVHKGDILVLIDPTDYQVALQRARADYEDSQAQAQAAQYGVPVSSAGSINQIRSASADMMSATAGVAASQKQVEAAQAGVIEAQADAQKANNDLERYRQLLGKQEVLTSNLIRQPQHRLRPTLPSARDKLPYWRHKPRCARPNREWSRPMRK